MKKIEILVVEDEPKLAQTISDFLRIQNYEVETALTGNKALEYFCQNKQKVDLILLDLMLPDISGYTVLKEIRKISEVPVIILSARSAVADKMSGFEKGADDYITKPFTLALVKMHIEAVLKIKLYDSHKTAAGHKCLKLPVKKDWRYSGKAIVSTIRDCS